MKQEARRYVVKKLSVMLILMGSMSMVFAFIVPQILPVLAATPPNIINYQGRILNANSVPVSNTAVDMEFRLYTELAGGVCVWSNSSGTCDGDTPASTSPISIPLIAGLFSVRLGDTGDGFAAIADSVFADNEGIYLEIEINGEVLAPRKRIVSAAYAINSKTLEGISADGFLKSDGDTATGNYEFTGTVTVADLSCDNCLDFSEFADVLTLDGATSIALDANDFTVNASGTGAFLVDLTSTGDFEVRDAGTAFFRLLDTRRAVFETDITTGDGFALEGHSVTSGDLLAVRADGITTGQAMHIQSSSLLSNNAGNRGMVFLQHNPTTVGSSTMYGSVLNIERNVTDGGGDVTTSSNNSPVVKINNIATGSPTWTDDSALLYLNQRHANATGATLQIWNESASGESLDIFHTAESSAIAIFSASETSNTVQITNNDATTGHLFRVANFGGKITSADFVSVNHLGTYTTPATITSNLINLRRALTVDTDADVLASQGIDSASLFLLENAAPVITSGTFTDSAPLMTLIQGNAAATGHGLKIDNYGTGHSLHVLQRDTTASTNGAVYINNSQNENPGLTVAGSSGTGTGHLVVINAGDSEADALNVSKGTAGAGVGLSLKMGTNASASPSKESQAIFIDTTQTGAERVFTIEADGFSNNVVFNIEANGDFQYDGTGSSPAADLAETYASADALMPGELVSIDSLSDEYVKRTDTPYDARLFGAVSTKPAIRMGSAVDGYDIALTGRIPLKVSAENGSIAIGDPLTSSATPGHAMKATEPGMIVGFALEAHAGGTGEISAFINTGWYAGNLIEAHSTGALVKNDLLFGTTGTATADVQGAASRAITFRGSGWNGTQAVTKELKLLVEVTNSDHYRLSMKDTDGSEVAFVNNEGDFALTGRLYPSDRGQMQTEKYIYYDGSGGGGGDFMRTNASGWGTGSYDFAEMFPAKEVLEPGTVVVFGASKEHVARSSGKKYDAQIAGIISTRPGFLAGDNLPGHVPVALAGRVPTKVSNENGAIKVGDPLTTSSTPGVAMKATEPGQIIGFAMESFNGTMGTVIVFVRASYHNGSSVPQFADNSVSGLVNGQTLSMDGDMNLNGANIFSVRSVTGIGGWKITETGDFSTKGRFIHRITSRQNESVETYAALGRESTIQLTGTVELKNGTAEVKFKDIDSKFSGIISADHPYRVFMTPTGSTGQLYVSEKDGDGFKIQETSGSSTILVDWMVVAYHKDFAPTQGQGSVSQVEVPMEDEGLLDDAEDMQGQESEEVTEEDEVVDDAEVEFEDLESADVEVQEEQFEEIDSESENENED